MTDQWEKYVEESAHLLDPGAFDQLDPHHAHWAMGQRRDIAQRRARLVLEQAGPHIQADTRERVVAAAARAVERECAEDPRAAVAAEIVARLVARRSEITPGRPGWGYLTEAIDMVNEVCGVEARP